MTGKLKHFYYRNKYSLLHWRKEYIDVRTGQVNNITTPLLRGWRSRAKEYDEASAVMEKFHLLESLGVYECAMGSIATCEGDVTLWESRSSEGDFTVRIALCLLHAVEMDVVDRGFVRVQE